MTPRKSTSDPDRNGEDNGFEPGWSPTVILALVSMCALLILLGMSYLFMTIALPSVAAQYNTTQGAWMITAFLLVGAVTSPLIGKLADSHGKRKLLLACALIAAAGALVSALAPAFGILVIGCALMGMLNPCVFLVYTLINDVFPKRIVEMSASIATSSMGLSVIPAPFLAGWLIDSYGFHSLFWFMLGCLILIAVAIVISTSESSHRVRSRIDLVGAILLGAGIAGLLVGISFGPVRGWSATGTLAAFIAGFILFVAWVVSANRVKEPLIEIRMLTSRAVSSIALAAGLGFGVGGVFTLILPYMAMTPSDLGLGYGFGIDATGYAFIQAPFGVATLLGGTFVGWALKHVGVRITMLAGFAIMLAGALLTALLHQSEAMVIVFTIIVGFGSGFAYASVPNLILTFIAHSSQATVGAITNVVQALTAAVLTVVAFTLLNSHIAMTLHGKAIYSNTGITLGFLLAVVVSILGFAVTSALPRRPAQPDSAQADGANTDDANSGDY